VIDAAVEGRVDENLVGELVDALADYGAVARAGNGTYGVIINVGQADDAVAAAIDGEHAFQRAVARVGLPAWPVVRLEVMTWAVHDGEIELEKSL